MKKLKKEIVKEQGEKGGMIYRYSDFDEKISENMISNGHLNWRFTLMISRFKTFLDLLGDSEEAINFGLILGPTIKDVEQELDAIAELIEKALGDIRVIYDTDKRYSNFNDESVAGLVLYPIDKKSKKEMAA